MRRNTVRAAVVILTVVIVAGTVAAMWLVGPVSPSHAAAGGTPAIDALVTTHQTSAGSSISSPTFSTTSGGELVIAFLSSDGPGFANQSFSAVTGGGLTWRLRQRNNAQAGTSEIWQAVASAALTNVVVKATRASGSYTGTLTVATFTGANTSVDGATAGASAGSGAASASLLTTAPGSWVWGVGNDWDQAVARTVGPNQTKVDEYLANTTGDTFWVQRQTNTTPLSGTTVTINDTAPTTDQYNLAIIEIPASVPTGPDLTLSMTHAGTFVQGQTGAYTITVTNIGVAATSGAVTLTDSLPAGLTATDISGTGWVCTLATLSCTRNDALAEGASYPVVTVTVNIASNAPASVTNAATVSGGGETNTANDTASDSTTISTALSVSPTSLVIMASQGANPPPSTVSVTSVAGGTVGYSASSDSSWLSVSPASGSLPQSLQLTANINGLALGTITGHVTIAPTGIQASSVTVTVTLNIGVATDWLTTDHDPSRSGYAADETTISTSNVGNLQLNWSAAVDGSVTAQPLYAHAIQISGQTRDVLVVATGGNSIYAFDAATGAVLWSRNFGPSTPSTYGLPDGFGIEASPVIDRVTNRIYTVSTDGVFRTISLLDGTDVYPGLTLVANPVTNKVWGGLNKVGNSVYVAVGSNGGDVAPWAGQVYNVDVSAAPKLIAHFVVVPSIANGGGGIWGDGGVSADIATGTIFAASAFDSQVNGSGNEGTTPYADSMMALTSQLALKGYYQPSQPSTYPCGGAPCDLDFASTPIYFQPAGCPTMVAAGNKNGNLYLFKVSDLETSGQPWQILTLNNPYDSIGLGGVANVPAYSPATNMLYIGDAGSGVTGVAAGLVALQFTSNCTMQVAWSNKLASANDVPNSTPTIANGVVFIGEGKTGIIHAYDAQTGTQLWQSGSQYHAADTFAAPIVAGGKVYAGSWSSFSGGGIVGAFSLNTPTPTLSVSPGSVSFNATVGGSNPAPATLNVTNSGLGSLNFTASSDSTWLNVAPASGTAPTSLQVSASISGLAAGTYTGHITVTAAGVQGSPAVIPVTLAVSSSSGGGTLAIDANVSKDNGSSSAAVTSPPFNTSSGNELLLAFVATDATSPNMTVTSVTGAGLTWQLVRRTNTRGGTAEIWRALATTALTNATVTASLSQSVPSSITVMSFTGVDTSGSNGSGAIGATGSANAASGAPSASLTTTRNNSWVLGVGNDYDSSIGRTVGANQTLIHQYFSPTGDTYWVQRQNAATPASGTVVAINDTAPTGDQYNLSIVEVLPHP